VSDSNVGAPAPKRSYPRLTKWAGIFTSGCFIILTLVQLYDWLGPVSLPDCDDSGVQTTIRDIFRDKTKTEISAMGAFTAAGKSGDGLSCTVDLTFNDKSRARLSYRVYLKDRSVMVATGDTKAL
jgi:hypothetical protein